MARTRAAGGMRAGTPGTAYPNRTDIAAQPSLPARVATDQTYGKAQEQLQAQRTVPMAPPPPPTGGAPSAGGQGPGAITGAPAPPAAAVPGGAGDLHRPTERPGEPVTAGAPIGAGPGPEAIPQGPSSVQNTNLSAMLQAAARSSGSQALAALAQHAAANGQ